ncbi:hypothetical protein GYMLUDRAFT_60956 [Collybiopsis luxurians FD-317 M1]|uniref:Uncharacterized protein n=1 Tax=Collybiopsis luxurians FD-317 M1 TaxID=944289 RepID=A0A0D0B3K6_9AGAR|nr:hypothetical protein GYMLUDRAFT_60956 [Collybiopsis luxurians FD-317 M1]
MKSNSKVDDSRHQSNGSGSALHDASVPAIQAFLIFPFFIPHAISNVPSFQASFLDGFDPVITAKTVGWLLAESYMQSWERERSSGCRVPMEEKEERVVDQEEVVEPNLFGPEMGARTRMAVDDDGRKQDVGIKRIPTLMTDGSEERSRPSARKFDNLPAETVNEGSAKVILSCPCLRLYLGSSYRAQTTLNKEVGYGTSRKLEKGSEVRRYLSYRPPIHGHTRIMR